MNRIYRTLWSVATQSWQAVPETAKTAGKKSKSSAGGAIASFALSWVLTGGASAQAPPAINQLPTGGTVARGTATINQTATAQAAAMTVNQTSQRAVVNWNTFNIGSAASVNFVQPNAQAVTLNRVNDSNPSQIFGRMTANGQVVLTNANGIYFAPGSSVDVGAITATTHSITDDNFMSGKYVFERNGATGKIINEGNITAALAGYVALLAPEVQNAGVVVARAGTVAMAAGETITLNIDGAGSLAGITTTPSAIATLIENKQAVQAPDGQIILSAVALNKLQAGVIKNSGNLEANSLVSKGGKIYLEGDDITLSSTSKLEAKGATGGGTVLVGGDWQGSGDMRQATKVTMEAGVTIDASATDKGDGGKVVLWSDVHNADSLTRVEGRIDAKASGTGNGGQVETSGHSLLVGDLMVNAQASVGKDGLWLLDPYDITISSAANASTAVATNTFTASASGGVVNATTLQNALASNSVTVSTTGAGTDAGNINVSSDLTWSSNKALTLTAAGGISGNGNISMTGAAGAGLIFNQVGNSTYSGNISGTNATLTKLGAGTLALTGNNSYGGGTTLTAGVLNLGSANAIGTSGTISFGGGTLQHSADNYTTDYSSRFGATSQTYMIDTNGYDITLASALGTSFTNTLNKLGSGTLTLTGSDTNINAITISGGSLQVGNGGITGALSASTLAVATSANTSLIFNRSDDVTYAYLTVNGAGGLTQAGSGTLNLTGGSASKAYSGPTYVKAGTLNFGNYGPGSSATKLIVDLGATFKYGGASAHTFGSLSGAGTIYTNSGLSLIIGADNSNTEFSGLFLGDGTLPNSGPLVTKQGTGTFIFSGTGAGNFRGFTASAGVIQLGKGGTEGALGPNLSFGGGTFSINRSDTVTLPGFYGSGTLRQMGSGTTIIGSSSGGFTGTTELLAGTLLLSPATSTSVLSTSAGSIVFGGGVLKFSATDNSDYSSRFSTAINQDYKIDTNGQTVAFASPLTSIGGALTKLDSANTPGTLILKGANTYTGTTTISAGVLEVGDSNLGTPGTLGAATAAVVNNGTLKINSSSAYTLTNPISGSGNLIQAGSGTTTVSGTNSFTGGIKINGGYLRLGSADALGSLGTISFGGGTLQYAAGFTTDYSSRFDTADGQAYKINTNGQDISFASVLGGLGSSLSKSGAGTLTLYGDDTYSGVTTISTGTLKARSATAFGTGAISVASGAVLDLNGQTMTSTGGLTLSGTGIGLSGALINSSATGATYAGLVSLGAATTIKGDTGAIALTNIGTITGSGYALTLDGVAGGSIASIIGTTTTTPNTNTTLTKAGTGTWTLSGANTYSGNTAITNGTLVLSSANTYAGTTTISAGSSLVVSGTGTLGNGSYAGAITNNGTFEYSSSATQTLSGVISGTGTLTKDTSTSSTLTLTGTSTYTGNTNINAGTLVIGGSGTLGSSGTYAGAISNSGTFKYSSSTAQTLSGVMSGSGTLIKDTSSTSTLTLAGINTYTGNTTITLGTLSIAGSGSLGSGTYAGEIIDNGTFQYASSANQTLSGRISGAGSLTKSNTSTLTLNGDDTYNGTTTISAGTLITGSATAFGTSAIGVSSGAVLDLNGQTMANTTGTLTLNGTGINSGGALINTSTAGATYASLVNIGAAGSSIVAGSGSIALTKTGTIGGSGSLTLGGAAGGTITSGIGTGGGSLTKQDAGTWTLNGINTYTGATTISAGTLVLTGANTSTGATTITAGTLIVDGSGSLGGGTYAGAITNNGTFQYSSSAAQTLSGVISGTGTLTKDTSTSSTLTLTGTSTYTGNTNINAGTLAIGGTGALSSIATSGTYAGAISNSGTLQYSSTAPQTLSGVISGTGTLNKVGGNTLTLTGINTYTGNTTITGSTLAIGGSGSLGSGTYAGTITDNGTFQFASSANQTLSGRITGTGGLTKDTSTTSTLTITGTNNDYTGYTVFGGGTLALGANNALPTTTVLRSASTTGILDLNGYSQTVGNFYATDAYGWTVKLGSGTLTVGDSTASVSTGVKLTSTTGGGLTKVGSGTIAFSVASTYNGTTQIDNGALGFANNAALTPLNIVRVNSLGTLIVPNQSTGQYLYINSLSGSGTIKNSSTGGQFIAVGGDNSDSTFSGTLYGGVLAGGLGIIKNGSGKFTFSGSPFPTTGASFFGYTVNGGTLQIGDGTTTGLVTGGITLANNSTAILNASGNSSISGYITGTGTLKIAAGNWSLSNTSDVLSSTTPYVGLDVAAGSSLDMGTGYSRYVSSLSGTGEIKLSTTNSNYKLNITNANDFSFAGLISGTGGITKSGAGILTLSGNNSYSGGTTLSTGTLKAGSATAFGTLTIVETSGAALDLNGQVMTSTGGLTLNGTGIGSGGALINSSATGATYAGLVTLGSATSIVGGAGTIALTNTGTISGATYGLTLDGAAGGSITSIIGTSSGTITKQGLGTWILSGANTFTGAVAINAGALRAANSTALGTTAGGVTVASGATLELGGPASPSGIAVGAEALTVADGGAVHNVAGYNTYAGAMTLSGNATITVDTGTTLNFTATTATAVLTGKRLTLNTNGDLTFSKGLSGPITAAYLKTGSGTLSMGTGNYGSLTAVTGIYAGLYDPTGTDYSSVYGSNPDYTIAFFNSASGGIKVNLTASDYSGTATWSGTLPTSGSAATTYSLSYASGLTVSNAVYVLLGATNATTWTVTPKPVTVTLTPPSSTYNGITTYADITNATTFTTTSLVGADAVTAITKTSSATGVAQAGNFTITPGISSLSAGAVASNYSFTLSPLTASVAKANLTLTGSKVYDGTTVAAGSQLTATGVNNEAFAITGLGASGNLSTANVQNNTALTSASGLSVGASNGSNAGDLNNYNTLSTTGSSFTVRPATATLAATKTYDSDSTLTSSQLTITGITAGGVTQTLGYSGSASLLDANVATANNYVTSSNLVLTNNGSFLASNYVLPTFTRNANNSATVNAATATVTASKTYDSDTTLSAGQVTITGVSVNGTAQTLGFTGTAALSDANVATANKYVNTGGMTLTDGSTGVASNYVLPASAYNATRNTATINRFALTATDINTATSVYGDTLAPGSVMFTNKFGADDVNAAVTVTVPAGSLSTGGAAKVGSYFQSASSSLSGAQAGNYSFAGLTSSSDNYSITQRALTASAISSSASAYASAIGPGTAQLSNAISGDAVAAPVTVNTGATSSSGHFVAGVYTQTAGTTLSGADAGNYSFTGYTSAANYTIQRLALTGTSVANSSSTYGSALAPGAVSWTNVVGADAVSASAMVATSTTSSSGQFVAGNYAQTVASNSLTGTDANNYSFASSFTTPSNNYTIQKLALTAAGEIASASSTYGSAVTPGALAFANVVTSDAVSATVSVNTSTLSSGGKPVAGSYTQTASTALTGADAGNYTYVGRTSASANYTIDPLTLTGASIASGTSVYGNALAPGAVSFGNLVSGDQVSSTATVDTSTRSMANLPVFGTYTQTIGSTLTGTDAANYNLPTGFTSAANYTISKKELLISVPGASRMYDGSNSIFPTGTSTILGLIGADNVSISSGNVTGFVDKNVGTNKPVTYTGFTFTGGDASNYVLSANPASTAEITAKPITVSGITANDKVYNATASASLNLASAAYTSGAASNTDNKVYTGDSVSIDTSSVAGTFSNANVGTAKPVTISGLALSGADANNYIVTDASNAAASITAKALTVSGLSTAATRAYNGTQVATISGTPTLLSAQVAGAGTGTDGTPYQGDVINITGAATGSYNSKDVGATTVTFGGLASSNSNYTLVLGTQAASITKADLSKVTATKVYDGLGTVTAAQVSAIEGVNGETFTASAGTASISDKNVATPNKVLTDLSSLSLASSNGGLVSNYNLSTNLPAAGSQNAVDISKANLSKVTADKVYDGLSTVTAAQVTAIEGVNGETFTAASGTANISNKNVATANKTLTDLSGLSLVGSSNAVLDSNYNLSINLPAAGALNAVGISQANASVSVTSANVVYNGQTQSQASPISNGFLSGDAITISGAASAKNAGTYASALSVTGSDATNYNVSITDANLTIGKAALTITGSSFTNTYNSQTQSVTGFTTSAMQGTDTAADLTNVTATGASARNAGTYTNTVSASAQTNYDLTLQNGTLQINRANASVGGISTIVTYNGQTQNQTAPNTTGFISGDAITIGGAASGKNVGTYASTLNVNGSDAANYNVSITDANMTIGKATLSISLSSQTKVYDGTSNATIANASYSLAGFVPGEGATFAQPLGSYNNANVVGASTVSAGIGAGNFTVNNGTLLSNYVLPTTVSGAGSITPAHLSATGTKTYDGLIGFDASSLTVAGVNGETFTANGSGTLSSKNVQTNQALTSTAGLSLSGNNGALMSNYTPLATGDTQVSVTARAVNMSAPSATKTYDSTTLYEVSATDLTSLSTQLVGGDRVAAAEVVYGDKNAGTGKRVTLNAVTINDDNGGNNYVIGKVDVQTGVINKAPLSVVVVNDARFINQADTAGYAGVVYNGFVGGETISVLTQGSVARSNANVNGAGQYTGVLQASGWQADNYAISYRDGNYTIAGAKTLLVRVSSASTIYGSTASYTPTAKYLAADGTTIMTLTPVVTGNTVTIDDGLGSQARFSIDASSAALSSSGNVQAGGYNLGASNVTKTGTNFENLVMTGGLTVTPKTLSNNLGVQSITKVYDGSTSISNLGLDFDRPLAGVTTGDTVTLVGSGSFDDRHVGTNKTVNLSLGLRGADAINYALTTSSLSTNVGEITQLASVTYTGASNGNWSDARNWAGGALPDRNNVAQVIVPTGKAVTYDSDQVGVIGSTLSVDGVIRFGSSNPFTLANTVSGAGDVQQRGTGMLTVSGSNNNFSGHLDIGSYAATLNNAQALGSGGVTANAGQLSVATGLTLPSLRVNGAVTLDSAIKTTGDQIYNGALTFLSSGTAQSPNFLSDSGNIEFVGTVSAGLGAKSAQRSMFVVASNGSVLLNDQVGRMVKGLDFNSQYLTSGLSDTSPYALNVTAQAIKLYGDVTTFESQTYNGAVRVGNNSLDPLSPQYKNATPTNGYTRLLVSMDPSITFKGTVDDADANGKTNGLDVRAISLTQLSANSPVPTITFDGDVGKLSALASLTAAAGIQNTANGAVVTDIKTDDASRRDQAYKGDIVLKGNITVDSAPILIAEQLLTDSNTTPTITWYNGSPDFLLRLPALNGSGNPPTINLPGNLLFVAGPNATAPTYIPASQLTRLGGGPESNSNTGSSNHAAPSSQGFATDAGALQSQILASGSPLQNLMGSGAGVMVADVQVGTPDNASPAKTQAQTVSVGSSGAFIQVREFAPTLLQAAQPFSYQLPVDTFRHSNATEMLTFSASLANGSALPAWLNFSSQELLFSGTPPSGVKSLEIEVFATDRQGRRASTRVRLVFGMEAGT